MPITMIDSYQSILSTVFEFGEVFCFTDFPRGVLFRDRDRVKVGVGGGFGVKVGVRASVRRGFYMFQP